MKGTAARAPGVEPGHLLTVAKAAEVLRVSVYRTRMVIADGSLASFRVGGRRYVPTSAIADYQNAREAHEAALRAAAPREWDWEGNLVSTLSEWFTQRGWQGAQAARSGYAIVSPWRNKPDSIVYLCYYDGDFTVMTPGPPGHDTGASRVVVTVSNGFAELTSLGKAQKIPVVDPGKP